MRKDLLKSGKKWKRGYGKMESEPNEQFSKERSSAETMKEIKGSYHFTRVKRK